MYDIDLRYEFEKLSDKFEYEYVQKVMRLLGWNWLINKEFRVPTIEDMQKSVRKLFNVAYNDFVLSEYQTVSASSGGFRVSIYENYDIDLEFILAEENFVADCSRQSYDNGID